MLRHVRYLIILAVAVLMTGAGPLMHRRVHFRDTAEVLTISNSIDASFDGTYTRSAAPGYQTAGSYTITAGGSTYYWSLNGDDTHYLAINSLGNYWTLFSTAAELVDQLSSSYTDPPLGSYEFGAVVASTGIDPNIVLALDFTGADGSTTFNDSVRRHTLTAVGNAQIDTAQFKYTPSGLLCDGTGDDATITASGDYSIGSGPATIEAWVRPHATNVGMSIIGNGYNAGFCFYFDGTSSPKKLLFYYKPSGSYTAKSVNWSPSVDTWYHVAVVVDANTVKFYIDGVAPSAAQAIAAISYPSGNVVHIGGDAVSADKWNGGIDGLVVRKSVRYSGDFTPPATFAEMIAP